MLATQADQIAEEIARDWRGRLFGCTVAPSTTPGADGWAVRAWDVQTQAWHTWSVWRDWVRWKLEQRGQGG